MLDRQEYWTGRYNKQKHMTVGNSCFSSEEFITSTARIRKVLRDISISYNLFYGKSILDFGCGWGRIARMLLDFGARKVVGVDLVEWAVKTAKAEVPNGDFEVFDGIDLSFKDETFDTVLSWTVLQHVPNTSIWITCQEIGRVLAKGGYLVLYENCASDRKDSDYIWFRPKANYLSFFKGYEILKDELVTAIDGTNEVHHLLIMRKPC